MGWWTALGDLLRGGKDVAEVFVENRENRGARQHEQWLADLDRDRAVLQQFAAEFHARQNRSAWDAIVDGLNRLPRPLLHQPHRALREVQHYNEHRHDAHVPVKLRVEGRRDSSEARRRG